MTDTTAETMTKHGHDHGHGRGHDDHEEHDPIHAENPHLAHHFDTPQQQFDAGKLGIWLFLVTEVLFFSGLFCAYTVYRAQHPEIFIWSHYFLDTTLGAINTGVLILSSLTAAWAVRNAQLNQPGLLKMNIVITIACACAFMGIKYHEYHHKYEVGLLPGHHFNPTEHVWEVEDFKEKHPEAAAIAEKLFEKKNEAGEGAKAAAGEAAPAAATAAPGTEAPAAVAGAAPSAGAPAASVAGATPSAGAPAAPVAAAPGAAAPAASAAPAADPPAGAAAPAAPASSAVAAADAPKGKATKKTAGKTAGDKVGSKMVPKPVAAGAASAEPAAAGEQASAAPAPAAAPAAAASAAAATEPTPAGAAPDAEPTPETAMDATGAMREKLEPLVAAGIIGPRSVPGAGRPKNAHIFFGLYFFMTGLHGIHVLVGIGIWIWMLVKAFKGQFGPKYFGPVDYTALYWHLVDLIWIYLFPLLYLIH